MNKNILDDFAKASTYKIDVEKFLTDNEREKENERKVLSGVKNLKKMVLGVSRSTTKSIDELAKILTKMKIVPQTDAKNFIEELCKRKYIPYGDWSALSFISLKNMKGEKKCRIEADFAWPYSHRVDYREFNY